MANTTKQPSEHQIQQKEKKSKFNKKRAEWFNQYMMNELPPFYRMRIPSNTSILLTPDQQVIMAKLIQAGIAAKSLLSEIDESVHLQKSIINDAPQIREFLTQEGYESKGLSREQVKKTRLLIYDSEQARNDFAQRNLGLVSQRAGKRRNAKNLNMTHYEDIVAEGKVGLMTAIDKFNPEIGTLFSTPATYWIDQSILSYLDSKTQTIKMPTHMNNIYKNIQYAHKELREQYGDDSEITDERISEWLNEHGKEITIEQIKQARLLRRETISYEAPFGDSENSKTLADMIDSHEDIAGDVVNSVGGLDKFNALVSLIDDNRKREILRDWYTSTEDQYLVNLSNVSRKHCLTKERVKQLKNEAEAELRKKISSIGLQNI